MKRLILIITMLFFVLSGCAQDDIGPSSNKDDYNEEKDESIDIKYADFINGFERADYEAMNSFASDNGLGNSKVWLDGSFSSIEEVSINNQIGYISTLRDSDGHDWLLMLEIDTFGYRETYEKFLNKKVILTGVYTGYSNLQKAPCISLYKIREIDGENTATSIYTCFNNLSVLNLKDDDVIILMSEEKLKKLVTITSDKAFEKYDSNNDDTIENKDEPKIETTINTPNANESITNVKEETPVNDKDRVSYSTNTKATVKNGDSGIYSYCSIGHMYDIYYIIDFDDGYVYRFIDEEYETMCDKVKIESGTLNDTVIITYHDDGITWKNGLHFKWVKQPDHLIVEDDDHYESDFYSTNLKSALEIMKTKTIDEY